MRNLHVKEITEAVKGLCIDANYNLGEDVIESFREALKTEESPTGIAVIEQLLENARIARDEQVPMCQDTGSAVVFVELGQDVHIEGGLLPDAISEGVRQGYKEGYLRKSICDPFTRKNTGDNTPAIIHLKLAPGDKLRITVAPKGGGSENMSKAVMLKPSDGIAGIKNLVTQMALEAGSNPCPPVIIGVGIGGNLETAALLAKKSLLRPIGSQNQDPEIAKLEDEIKTIVNDLGIGPQGFGGRVFALAVHIDKVPCHIASLPVAVNFNCHAARHKEIAI